MKLSLIRKLYGQETAQKELEIRKKETAERKKRLDALKKATNRIKLEQIKEK